MITYDFPQGSPEWQAIRLGLPTASNFDKIITEKKMQLSASCDGYAHKLLAELVLGVPLDNASSGFMERGSAEELKAREWYEMQRNVDVEQVGFLMRDDHRAGASPDGLVGTDGLIEIKVPSAHIHMGYLLDADIGYKAQVQGLLWISERGWLDTISYHPSMPKGLTRQVRDEVFIKALERTVLQFAEYLEELKARLISRGLFTAEDFRKRDIAPAPVRQMKYRLDPDMEQYRRPEEGVLPISGHFAGPTEDDINAGTLRNEERAAKAGL